MKVKGSKVFIRFFENEDAEDLFDLQSRNREFFQQRSPTFKDDSFTLESQRKYIIDSIGKREKDEDYSFGICLNENGKMIGTVSLFHIQRGPIQKCMIGYTLDQQFNGHGYTTEAVRLATEYAFHELKLHRVEAGVMPDNIGSIRVLEKAGYQREGVERKGVKINGQWQDHQMFAQISDINE